MMDLDDEAALDMFLDKINNEYKDGWTEENWEEEIEKHPLFMTKIPEDSDNLPAAVEAIRQLKWDPDDTPKEKAIKLKDEGNLLFRAKNYKNSILSYTQALKEKIDDEPDLMSVLHSNRAASHFYIKNYRSALSDCVFARKLNPQNIKPYYKAADCCFELQRYDDCLKWCDWGLSIVPEDKKLREVRSNAEANKKTFEKEKRKRDALERKKTETKSKIWNLIKEKGIRVQEKEKEFSGLVENPVNPVNKVVSISEDGTSLIWPVVFLYPEFGQTDFVEAFDENSTFEEHINLMFSESPGWDTDKKYNPNSIQIYYENRAKSKLIKLKQSLTLLEALKQDGMIIQLGTPNFILMVRQSEFEKIYLQKYNELH